MSLVRKAVKWGALAVLVLVLAFGMFVWSIWDEYSTPILMYHHVRPTETLKSDSVSPRNFIYQMDFIKRNRFNVLSLQEYVEIKGEGKKAPRKSVVISFDDGYVNNYTNAFPILKGYGFPAIIFIPSDLMGTAQYLNWEQIQEMNKNGIEFGSHTRGHHYLPTIASEDELRDEIFNSKKIIEGKIGQPVKFFCYPIGGFTERVKALLAEAGYVAAVTTNRGSDKFNNDLFELNRVKLGDRDTSDFVMWFKLSGFYNYFRSSKKSH